MKLSFTTLGCPDWSLDKIIAKAVEFGFDAIDFRGMMGVMELYRLPEFTTEIKKTRNLIQEAGLEVSCFSSSVQLCRTDKAAAHVEEITEYSKLCKIFGTTHIRVFGGKIGKLSREEALEKAAKHWKELAELASSKGVKLLLETHDDWVDSMNVRALIEHTKSDHVGVLWDVHHSYRMAGEPPEVTMKNLGPWIANTHWKDSKAQDPAHHENGKPFSYCFMGEGDIPLEQALQQLREQNYDGYYTLEWEKKWHPELPDADQAFPQYVQYMKQHS